MKKIFWWLMLVLVAAATFVVGVRWERKKHPVDEASENNDANITMENKDLPLEKYAFDKLTYEQASASEIVIEEITVDEEKYWSVIFTFAPEGKKMSGLLNIPKEVVPPATILMLRGFAPLKNYVSGVGTKNGAAYYVREGGFLTIAPDFFGYGQSDPEPEDGWEARLEKPLLVMDLIKSLENGEVRCSEKIKVAKGIDKEASEAVCQPQNLAKITTDLEHLALWGHSNGGQIAMSVLEIMKQPLPTTLWAAVTAPFPYSVLFFTNENEDEGKGMRKWLANFEDDYDVFDFSITQHLSQVAAQTFFQLHHGSSDEAAPIEWGRMFAAQVRAENEDRDDDEKFEFKFYEYSGADHNLRPSWDTVVARDLEFFEDMFGTASAQLIE